MGKSQLENIFTSLARELQIDDGMVNEYKFDPNRKWRFDFAWPAKKIAFEIEGGIWVSGRHNHPAGFINDCEKYNQAASLGWSVYRITNTHLTNSYARELLQQLFYGQAA